MIHVAFVTLELLVPQESSQVIFPAYDEIMANPVLHRTLLMMGAMAFRATFPQDAEGFAQCEDSIKRYFTMLRASSDQVVTNQTRGAGKDPIGFLFNNNAPSPGQMSAAFEHQFEDAERHIRAIMGVTLPQKPPEPPTQPESR